MRIKRLPLLCLIHFLTCAPPLDAQNHTWEYAAGGMRVAVNHSTFSPLSYRLLTRVNAGQRVRVLEGTPQGGWLMIGDGWWERDTVHSLPSALQSWINAYRWWGQTVDAVAFEPDGDWIIVAGSSYRTSGGIQSSFFGTFTGALGRGERVRSIAFDADGNGWVLATDQQTYQMNVPSGLYSALYDCRIGDRPVRQVKFGRGIGGGWFLTTDRWSTTSEGYGDGAAPSGMARGLSKFNRLGQQVDQVAAVGNGWAAASNGSPAQPTALVDRLLSSLGPGNDGILQRMADLGVPGMSVAVVRNDRINCVRGYGVLEDGKDDVVTSRSRFPAASLSKAVAAATLLSVVEDGLVDLDRGLWATLSDPTNTVDWQDLFGRWVFANYTRPVTTTIPSPFGSPVSLTMIVPDARLAGATPRMLLSHTSGLNKHGIGLRPLSSTEDLEDQLLWNNGDERTFLIHDPATVYDYSGGGFCAAQALMEAATQQSFEVLARDRILFPLGMYRSSFTRNVNGNGLARGHDEDLTAQAVGYCPGQTAGGLTTTAMDYARFLNCISLDGRRHALAGTSDRVLGAFTVRQSMLRGVDDAQGNVITNAPFWPRRVPCLGVMASTQTQRGRYRFIEHGGVQNGFSNFFFLHPDSGTGFVVFINKHFDHGGETLMKELGSAFRSVYAADFQ